MSRRPLTSIIIPTYNYAHYICEAIDSLLNSDLAADEYEIIIIDDGSTDDTAQKIKKYSDRISYIFQNNAGKASATAAGIAQARGKYLFNLDADDLFLPEKLREVVTLFEQDDELVHIAHPAICWQFERNQKTIEEIPAEILNRKIAGRDLLAFLYRRAIMFGGGSTFAARTSVLKRLSIPKEIDMYIDEYLVLATLNYGYSFFIDKPLSLWRIHGANFSEINVDAAILEKRATRSLQSMLAVLAAILNSDLPEEIKRLYTLKIKVIMLANKEKTDEKSFAEVIDMWRYYFRSSQFFRGNRLKVAKSYTLFNRTMPALLIKLLRNLKPTRT